MAPANVLLALSGLLTLAQTGPAKPANVEARSDVPEGYYVPAYYPAPFGGWVDSWAESYEKARDLVDRMTLAEKTNITAGSGIFMGESTNSWLRALLTSNRVSETIGFEMSTN